MSLSLARKRAVFPSCNTQIVCTMIVKNDASSLQLVFDSLWLYPGCCQFLCFNHLHLPLTTTVEQPLPSAEGSTVNAGTGSLQAMQLVYIENAGS